MSDTPAAALARLQGVWFPTHISDGGRLASTHQPRFPAGPDGPWLMTVWGNGFHVTADAGYYAAGGWLRVVPEYGRLTFVYPDLPGEWDTRQAYRLDGDELLLASGGFPWSGPHDSVSATRYVRVAPGPTPDMLALIEPEVKRWVVWYPGRADR